VNSRPADNPALAGLVCPCGPADISSLFRHRTSSDCLGLAAVSPRGLSSSIEPQANRTTSCLDPTRHPACTFDAFADGDRRRSGAWSWSRRASAGFVCSMLTFDLGVPAMERRHLGQEVMAATVHMPAHVVPSPIRRGSRKTMTTVSPCGCDCRPRLSTRRRDPTGDARGPGRGPAADRPRQARVGGSRTVTTRTSSSTVRPCFRPGPGDGVAATRRLAVGRPSRRTSPSRVPTIGSRRSKSVRQRPNPTLRIPRCRDHDARQAARSQDQGLRARACGQPPAPGAGRESRSGRARSDAGEQSARRQSGAGWPRLPISAG